MLKNILGFFVFFGLILHSYAPAMAAEGEAEEEAHIYIADVVGRYLPTMTLSMEPGAYEKRKILYGNQDRVEGVLVMEFAEKNGYFGFSALICDEENALLYERREKAVCARTDVNSKNDRVQFKYKAAQPYYLFIVNKSQPLNVYRDITIHSYAHTKLNKTVREKAVRYMEDLNARLKDFFDLEPWNFAIIPCKNKYVPSSSEERIITVCSEFALNRGVSLAYDVIPFTVFYEMALHLQEKWQLKSIRTETTRLQFAAMMGLLFSPTKTPFDDYLDLHRDIDDLDEIIRQYPQYSEKYPHSERVRALRNISNDPFSMMDRWLNFAYENMTGAILEEIKDGNYRHFGFLRNAARLELKRRIERQQDTLKKDGTEEKNIISDFW